MGIDSLRAYAHVSIWALAMLQCWLWMMLAGLGWVFRDHSMFRSYTPPVTAEHTALAVVLTAVAILNVVALALYIARPQAYGWWVLVVVQAAALVTFSVLFAIEASEATRKLWIGGGAVAGLTVILLCTVARPQWRRPTRDSL